MPVKKPTKSSLEEAKRKTRKALMEALRAIREAKKSVGKVGSYGPAVDPVSTAAAPNTVLQAVDFAREGRSCFSAAHAYVHMQDSRISPHVPTKVCGVPPAPKGVTKRLRLSLYGSNFGCDFS